MNFSLSFQNGFFPFESSNVVLKRVTQIKLRSHTLDILLSRFILKNQKKDYTVELGNLDWTYKSTDDFRDLQLNIWIVNLIN